MMTHLSRPKRIRRGAAGAVAFIYFSLLAVPAMMFAAGLGVDFTRIVVASRQVSNATEAAALAGAQEFIPDTTLIDATAATRAAQETYCAASRHGAMRYTAAADKAASVACPGGSGRVTLEVLPVRAGAVGGVPAATEVTVTARFKVTGLLFTRFWGAGSEFDPGAISKSASVCVPGKAGPTGGFCAKPGQGG